MQQKHRFISKKYRTPLFSSGKTALYALVKDIAGRYYKKQYYDMAAGHYEYLAQNHSDIKEAFKAQMRVVDSKIEFDDAAGVQQAISSLFNDFAEVADHSKKIYLLANNYYRAGKYSNAETLYQFVAGSGNSGDLAIKAAAEIVSCKIAAGNTDQADQVLDTLKSSQSDHPKFYESLFSLGERLLKLDKRERAMELYQYIAANSPDAGMKINAQSEVVLCLIGGGDAGVIDAAIAAFKSVYSANPHRCKKLNYIANALKRAGRYDKASDLFVYISQNTADSSVAQKSRMRAIISRIKMGDYEGAEQAFEQFWSQYRTSEGFVDRVVSICKVFEGGSDPDKAIPYIDRALEVTEDIKAALRLLRLKLMCYIDMGAVEEAQAVRDEIALYTDQEFYPGVVFAIADKYRKNGEYENAIEEYQKVLDSKADKDQKLYAHAGMGMSSVWLGDDEKARARIDLIFADYKNHRHAGRNILIIGEEYYKMASKALRDRDKNHARQCWRQVISLWDFYLENMTDKYCNEVCYLRGVAYHNLEEYEKAIECFELLLEKYPDYYKAWHGKFLIAFSIDRMHRRKELTYDEAKSRILEQCIGYDEKYPKARPAFSSWMKRFTEKYSK